MTLDGITDTTGPLYCYPQSYPNKILSFLPAKVRNNGVREELKIQMAARGFAIKLTTCVY